MHAEGRVSTVVSREKKVRKSSHVLLVQLLYRDYSHKLHVQLNQEESVLCQKTYLTDIIQRYNPFYSEVSPAIENAIGALASKRTCIKARKTEVPPKFNILGGRLVPAIIDAGTPREVLKSYICCSGTKGCYEIISGLQHLGYETVLNANICSYYRDSVSPSVFPRW